MQDLYLHFSQITRLDGVFFGPVLSFPVISATTPHRREGSLLCSHERQLVAGTERRNVADFGCSPFPCPGRICPYKCWSTSGASSCSWWHHSSWELLLLLSLPHSPSLKPGILGNLLLEPSPPSLFLGRWISYKTLPHTCFKSLTAAPLCSCKGNVPSHSKTCLFSLPPLKNIRTMNNKINVLSG